MPYSLCHRTNSILAFSSQRYQRQLVPCGYRSESGGLPLVCIWVRRVLHMWFSSNANRVGLGWVCMYLRGMRKRVVACRRSSAIVAISVTCLVPAFNKRDLLIKQPNTWNTVNQLIKSSNTLNKAWNFYNNSILLNYNYYFIHIIYYTKYSKLCLKKMIIAITFCV